MPPDAPTNALDHWTGTNPLQLIGPPGIGKTRIAQTWARDRKVVWTNLQGIATADAVVHYLAVALGLDDDRQAFAALRAMAPDAWVIDDAEGAADALSALSQQFPAHVPLLITSRVRVGLPDAQVVDVPPLNAGASFALFVERAQALDRGFNPAPHAEAIAALCAQLDGLPLAIELAASRIRTLSPKALLERLSLDQLQDRRRAGRHQSLRKALAASVDALTEPARLTFSHVAAFLGPFSLDAVEGAQLGDADHLDELLDAGLIQPTGTSRTFRLLGPVRAYARELHQDPLVDTKAAAWVLDDAEGRSAAGDADWWAAWRLQLESAVPLVGIAGARAAVSLGRRAALCGPVGLQAERVRRLEPLEDLTPDLRALLHRSVAVEAVVRNEFDIANEAITRALACEPSDAVRAQVLVVQAQIGSDTRTESHSTDIIIEEALACALDPRTRAEALLVRSVNRMRLRNGLSWGASQVSGSTMASSFLTTTTDTHRRQRRNLTFRGRSFWAPPSAGLSFRGRGPSASGKIGRGMHERFLSSCMSGDNALATFTALASDVGENSCLVCYSRPNLHSPKW